MGSAYFIFINFYKSLVTYSDNTYYYFYYNYVSYLTIFRFRVYALHITT